MAKVTTYSTYDLRGIIPTSILYTANKEFVIKPSWFKRLLGIKTRVYRSKEHKDKYTNKLHIKKITLLDNREIEYHMPSWTPPHKLNNDLGETGFVQISETEFINRDGVISVEFTTKTELVERTTIIWEMTEE